MVSQLQLGDLTVEVVLKDIKNVHLSVYPPTGRVKVTAPSRMRLDTIRAFVISKLDWIKRQQEKLRGQARETPRDYLDRESHYLWGKRYLLKVVEAETAPAVTLTHSQMHLQVRPGTDGERKQAIVEAWYRDQLRAALPPLAAKWGALMGVEVARFYVQRMRTRWGTCNPRRRSIRLNTELAKKPRECLEYILVHEMVHLLEPSHNARFVRLMDHFMPKWRHFRERLNQLPIREEDWDY